MKKQDTKNKKWIIPGFFIIVIIPVIWFTFLNKPSDLSFASEKLKGDWLRSDGTYSISISKVSEQGKMTVAYFNPKPIHVETASWIMEDGILIVQISLNDVNYRGSNYKLTYDEQSDQLRGTYYLASTKQTYDVVFDRKKDKN